uniref:Phosphofructokinase domain-containing protein n=1 Tax=Solanum lycopersicum TaxID=4081 RepID=A0A3Q7G4E3_SOLLC
MGLLDDWLVFEDVPHLSDYFPNLSTYPNPLKNNPSYSVVNHYFIYEDDTVAQNIVVDKNSPRGIHFRRVGPSQNVYFKPDTIISEIVYGLYSMYGVTRVMGIDGGYQGFYSKKTIPLTPKVVNDIHKRGGTNFGSSRGAHITYKIVDSIKDGGIKLVYIITEDGTLKGASLIFEEITRHGLNVAVVGIPKTIDNEIPVIDKSLGFDSAVEEAQRAISAAHVEAMSFENGIGVVKLMGRDSGFVAMYASLASRDVDCCLIPESRFYLEGHGGVLEVVAEGAGQDNEQVDVGLWISKRIKELFSKEKKMASDNVYCTLLAHSVVHKAISGYTGFMIGPVKNTHSYIPFDRFTEKQHKQPSFLSTTRSADIIEANKDKEPPTQLSEKKQILAN